MTLPFLWTRFHLSLQQVVFSTIIDLVCVIFFLRGLICMRMEPQSLKTCILIKESYMRLHRMEWHMTELKFSRTMCSLFIFQPKETHLKSAACWFINRGHSLVPVYSISFLENICQMSHNSPCQTITGAIIHLSFLAFLCTMFSCSINTF